MHWQSGTSEKKEATPAVRLCPFQSWLQARAYQNLGNGHLTSAVRGQILAPISPTPLHFPNPDRKLWNSDEKQPGRRCILEDGIPEIKAEEEPGQLLERKVALSVTYSWIILRKSAVSIRGRCHLTRGEAIAEAGETVERQALQLFRGKRFITTSAQNTGHTWHTQPIRSTCPGSPLLQGELTQCVAYGKNTPVSVSWIQEL